MSKNAAKKALGIKDSKFLRKARARFKLADSADSKQSEREREDLAFYNDEQWPTDVQLQRQGQQPTNGMPAVPARPTLVINKIKEPVRQILNQERASDLGIQIVPADDFGDLGIIPDSTEIDLREGLVRMIQRDSHAADARSWAFSRAVIAGRGYYMVMTRYLPGKTADQEIYIHRIYNQDGVRLDPAHVHPDGSDCEFEFVGTWVPWDKFAAHYPTLADGKDNPFSDASAEEFIGMMEAYPEWYQETGDGDNTQRAVRVTDYFYAEYTNRELSVMADGSAQWSDELTEDDEEPVDTRTVVEKVIKYCKIGGGILTLEETDWPGPDMPIVKVVGEEIQPYDDQRRSIGMVRPARAAQMGENYLISKFVETVGLTPIPALQVDPDAIDGYEAWYAVANTRSLPFLPSRTYDDQGRQLKEPHRPAIDPNILPLAQGISLFDTFIRSTTAVPDPTLGNVDPSLKSGKAINATVANAAQSTSNFLDNLSRSIRYEGQIVNNLLYPVYGTRPGRLLRLLNHDGEPKRMQIAQPPVQPMQGMPSPVQPEPEHPQVKLTEDAHFNVIVKVTTNSEKRREQLVQTLGQIIAADPQQMMIQGDLLYKNMDVPDHKEMAERQKVVLVPQVQAYLAAKDSGQPIPPAAMAKIAALEHQVQQAQQLLQQLGPKAEGKQLESDTKIKIEEMRQMTSAGEQAAETHRDREANETKLAVAELGAKVDRLALFLEERARLGMQGADAASQASSQAHDAAMAAQEHDNAMTQQQDAIAGQAALNPPKPPNDGSNGGSAPAAPPAE